MDDSMYDPAYTPEVQREQATVVETTTTTTTQRTHTETSEIAYITLPVDKTFIKSPAGILKVVEILFGLIVWACVVAYLFKPANGWVLFVSMTFFLLTIVNYVLFTFTLTRKITFVNWLWEEIIFNGVAAVLYLTAAITECFVADDWAALITACVFLWFNTVLYTLGWAFSFRKLKGKWPWQKGEVTRSAGGSGGADTWEAQHQPPATIESPAYEYDTPKY